MAVNRAVAGELNRARFFVRGLPWSTCEESLKSFFSRYGNVKKATVIFDKNSGLSKQYGFVEMKTVEEAERIIAMKSFYLTKGRRVEVAEAMHKKYDTDTRFDLY
ncbi:PREDICTED: protein boule-like [Amphimedon queenslandica]|uniref:RRM domain-containing protein n=1 Tax=Amphimedon queenslandica TaxID=400682 RepID=A0A1X7UP03_AMPQE|nr:PREDICTED: protein boule-like [Amphimedon queenslandica]|eukprot:XP_011404503.1 PREDICTED: protein boule-like [Amphimedon queenslandica]